MIERDDRNEKKRWGKRQNETYGNSILDIRYAHSPPSSTLIHLKPPLAALRQSRVLAARRVSGPYYLHYVNALRALVPLA